MVLMHASPALRNQLLRSEENIKSLESRLESTKRTLRETDEREIESRRRADLLQEKLNLVRHALLFFLVIFFSISFTATLQLQDEFSALRQRAQAKDEELERLETANSRMTRAVATLEQQSSQSSQDVEGTLFSRCCLPTHCMLNRFALLCFFQ